MDQGNPHLDKLDRCGNAPCLDFTNTVRSRLETNPRNYLNHYADLIRWARGSRLLKASECDSLMERARLHPSEASEVTARALVLRETIYHIFCAYSRGEKPAPEDLHRLNDFVGEALAHRAVQPKEKGFHWSWHDPEETLDRFWWPLAYSAADLLVHGDPRRLRECPPPDGCGWLYLDISKNGRRRWCAMKTCGSLAKARAYNRRKKRSANHT